MTPGLDWDRGLFWFWVSIIAFTVGSAFTYAFMGTTPPIWSLYTIIFIVAFDGFVTHIRNRLTNDNNSFLRRSNEDLHAKVRKLQGRQWN